MPERIPTGSSAGRFSPVNPSSPQVLQALAFNKLTRVPDNWVTDASGHLRLKDPEGTLGPLVPINEPTKASFLNELAHATPYIAAALAMGVGSWMLGGAGGPAAGGIDATATSGLGPVALPGAGTALPTVAAPATSLPAGVTLEGTAAGGGGASTTVGAGTGGAGYSTNEAGVVTDAASVLPESGSAFGGLSYGDLLKYGLPVAGNLIGGVIQAKASGAATDAQQKYLEEALAYQKESDLYNRGVAAAAVTKEAARYGDYTGRIAPWVANGTNANDRMSTLLGLPARVGAGSSAANGGGYRGGQADDSRSIDVGQAPQQFYAAMQEAGLNPVAVQGHGQTIVDAINKKYPGLGATVDPTTDAVIWPGLGAIDVTVDSGKGGWSFRPSGGAAGAYSGPATTRPPASTTLQPTASPAPSPTSAPAVEMKAPDGSVKRIPANQVDHYTSLGATLLQGAA